MKFQTALAPIQSDVCAGFASSGSIDPSQWADELFNGEVPGPWLMCYMVRRFGWPNTGSDNYKNLCSWNLTTPIKGLYLCVTPYLGGSNLHFAVRFNKEVQSKINKDPGRESFFRRASAAKIRWWNTVGRKLYTLGGGTVKGDKDELVHAYSEPKDGKVYGLWKRKPHHAKFGKNNFPEKNGMAVYWLGEFIKQNHPEVKLPKMTKREQASRVSRYDMRVRAAIKSALSDLLRPTNVRDISFTIFGDIEHTSEAVKRYSNQNATGYFVGAGYTPEYWFKHATKKERLGQA